MEGGFDLSELKSRQKSVGRYVSSEDKTEKAHTSSKTAPPPIPRRPAIPKKPNLKPKPAVSAPPPALVQKIQRGNDAVSKQAITGQEAKAEFTRSTNHDLDVTTTNQLRVEKEQNRIESKLDEELQLGQTHAAGSRKALDPKREAFDEWETYFADGEPYYVNRKTGETTWDKPDALLSEAEKEALEGEFVWVKHTELAWIPARIISRDNSGGLLVEERGQGIPTEELNLRRKVAPSEIGDAIENPQLLHNLTDDLVQLDSVHEATIIDLLRRRYNKNKIYTSVGDILVAVNPFKPTNLFTPSLMHKYAENESVTTELPPHPYSIINAAYQNMISRDENQSLLISGESGAGKTVTVKVCLEFLSEIAGSESNIEEKILQANPILEAFGNAKTVRNDNSSRFGKFMEIHFQGDMHRKQIVGCYTVNYLLEKSRVVAQPQGERNFHVFYYVLSQFPEEKRQRLYLDKNGRYNYICSSEIPDLEDDSKEASKMLQAMEEMGFTPQERDGIFHIVAALLHLGNVDFEPFESTGSRVKAGESTVSLETFCKLVGVNPDEVASALTMHVSQQRDGLLKRAFNPSVAADTRNALSRHLYGRLFEWLVQRVNAALVSDPEMLEERGRSSRNLTESSLKEKTTFIGMLDIFGFEIFEINSFEQLCINFANEKLQQMFNRHTFTLEEQTYMNEGIPFEKIIFHDSQPLLDFLGFQAIGEQPIRDGLFQLLDEQTTIGSGTDENFFKAISARHREKKKLFSDYCKSRTAFRVYHYAGAVEYEITGFCAKNADKLYSNVEQVMASSSNELVRKLFKTPKAKVINKKKTQASVFVRQLQLLEARTLATFPRYIRCVKPNSHKLPDLFNATMCLQQLRFAGVFEAVSIRKLGYPFRHSHQRFFMLYRCIAPDIIPISEFKEAKKLGFFKETCKKLLRKIVQLVPAAVACHIGESMVLYRATEHRGLEIKRLEVVNSAAAKIQKMARGMLVRMHVSELRSARVELSCAIRARSIDKIRVALQSSEGLFFKIKEAYDAEIVAQAIQEEHKIAPEIVDLLTAAKPVCSDTVYEKITIMMKRINRFRTRDNLAFRTIPDAMELESFYNDFLLQVKCREEIEVLISDIPRCTLDASLSALGDAYTHGYTVSKSSKVLMESFNNSVAVARTKLDHLETEKKLFENAKSEADHTTISGHKGDLNLPQSLQSLKMAIKELSQWEKTSVDVTLGCNHLNTLLKLREAVLEAVENGEHADDEYWRRVESMLRECSGLNRELEYAEYKLDILRENEIGLIGTELALRAAVDDVVEKITAAVSAVDDEALAVALDQGHQLELSDHKDESIRTLMLQAEELLPQLQDCRAKLHLAVEAVNESLLLDALSSQNGCGYGESPGMVGYTIVQEARQLYAWTRCLGKEAKIAVETLELDPVREVVAGCEEISLNIPELTILKQFLGLPKDEQLLKQRDAAVRLRNYRRAVRLAIEERNIFFAANNGEYYRLQHFPKLKSPEDFAKRFGLHWAKYKNKMLSHYNPTFGKIHTSLTVLDPVETKQATILFKNIFGIMGDKFYASENVDGLLADLLTQGLNTPSLRDEIYCQLCKQLTDNPKPESVERGWNLMSLLLATFCPSKEMETYLECFLRYCGKTDCVEILHKTLLGGSVAEIPSLHVLSGLRTPGRTSLWFDSIREHITLTSDMWDGIEQPDQEITNWKLVKFDPNELRHSLSCRNVVDTIENENQHGSLPVTAFRPQKSPLLVNEGKASTMINKPKPPPPPPKLGFQGSVPPPPPPKRPQVHE